VSGCLRDLKRICFIKNYGATSIKKNSSEL
jgi:hypothetical protein